MLILTKKQFLNKYDFLHALNRPEELGGLSDDELAELINASTDNSFEIRDEFDSLDYLHQIKDFNDQTNKEKTYENIRLIEGQIIDAKAKKFINEYYQSQHPDQVVVSVDFDELTQSCTDSLAKFYYGKKGMKTNFNQNAVTIMFQPTLIDEKMKLVTKPDALVFRNCFGELMEVKGTTTSKRSYLLDLFFQKKSIENSSLNIKITNFLLCLIAYKKTLKNEVNFTVTDSVLLTRNYTETAKLKAKRQILGKFHPAVIGQTQQEKLGILHEKAKLKYFLNENEFNNSLMSENQLKQWKQFYIKPIVQGFNSFINLMGKHANQIKSSPQIIPTGSFTNFFQDFGFLGKLKKYGTANGKSEFGYSGDILCGSYAMISYLYQINPDEMIGKLTKEKNSFLPYLQKEVEKNPPNYFGTVMFSKAGQFYNQCLKNHTNVYMNKRKVQKKLEGLKKNNKIYFDFETISLAISPMNGLLPFVPVITQCSILKQSHELTNNCLNLLVDPKEINVTFGKQIIDNLFVEQDACYIVYNQAFEKTRLKELIEYINEIEYTKKIKNIIQNLFDLADFLNLNNELICIKQLCGNYSIKKVLPLVLNDFKLSQETKIVDYNKLDIQNGDQCQNVFIQRFYGLIDDEHGKNMVQNLKKYCENDVGAMVAIEKYIKNLVQKYDLKTI